MHGWRSETLLLLSNPLLQPPLRAHQGDASHSLPLGSGYGLMQLAWSGEAMGVGEDGCLAPLPLSALDWMEARGVRWLVSRRARDLTLLHKDGVLDMNSLAYGLYFHTDRCGRQASVHARQRGGWAGAWGGGGLLHSQGGEGGEGREGEGNHGLQRWGIAVVRRQVASGCSWLLGSSCLVYSPSVSSPTVCSPSVSSAQGPRHQHHPGGPVQQQPAAVPRTGQVGAAGDCELGGDAVVGMRLVGL